MRIMVKKIINKTAGALLRMVVTNMAFESNERVRTEQNRKERISRGRARSLLAAIAPRSALWLVLALTYSITVSAELEDAEKPKEMNYLLEIGVPIMHI